MTNRSYSMAFSPKNELSVQAICVSYQADNLTHCYRFKVGLEHLGSAFSAAGDTGEMRVTLAAELKALSEKSDSSVKLLDEYHRDDDHRFYGDYLMTFDENGGSGSTRCHFDENGEQHGPYRSFDAHGRRSVEENYEHGELHGISVLYSNTYADVKAHFHGREVYAGRASNLSNLTFKDAQKKAEKAFATAEASSNADRANGPVGAPSPG